MIIAYKLTKAPLSLALAIWLTLASRSAVHAAEAFARDISEGGATLARCGAWMREHLTRKLVVDATVLAWVDGVSTALEGLLLFQGRVWGEWIVVAALAALVPVEVVSLERHPSAAKLAVLSLNAGVVAYLTFRRIRLRPRGSGSAPTTDR
jgi:uncharacterized membrane protein (DUF2068 family)